MYTVYLNNVTHLSIPMYQCVTKLVCKYQCLTTTYRDIELFDMEAW